MKLHNNCIIRPHRAGLFSLVNNVATCCEIYDNVGVDWYGPHYYDSENKDGNLWNHLFARNPAKGALNILNDSFELVAMYPDQHLTYKHVAKHYCNPNDPWRVIYHAHWQHWGVREQWLAKAEEFIERTFSKEPFIAIQVRSDHHGGEQITGRAQSFQDYEAAISAQCKELGLYVAASDKPTAQHFVEKLRAKIYPETRRGADRNVDFHLSIPQTWKDAENVLIEVLIMSRAIALIHPVSNMATAALYINPHVRSIYIP